MTDAIQVLDAGWQFPVNPLTLLPYDDGVISFYEAGTTTPKEVFADAALATTLGTSVACNSLGYPVSSGNAKTLLYVGAAPYKIRVSSSEYGGTIVEFDDVKGALDTSVFLTTAAVADVVIVPTSTNRTITAADKGKLLNVDCTSGDILITVSAASVLTSGFSVGIRHDGTANAVKINGNGVNTFGLPGVNVLSFSLTGRGQVVWVACDGSNFKVYGETPALIGNTTGVILIADRLSAPPASPAAGSRYIVTASPTGAWSTFAQHDIAEATGQSTWFKYTPPTDSGWVAYIQDEDIYYVMRGTAWETQQLNIGRSTNFPTEAIYPGALVAIIQDQKAQNTAGGTFTSGADQTRTLNTLVYSRNSAVTLSSDQFTLPVGTWEISWWAPSQLCGLNQTILRNITSGSDVARGSSAQSNTAPDNFDSTGIAVVTLVAPAAFEIRHRCASTRPTDGFGLAANLGTEIYTRVVIRTA